MRRVGQRPCLDTALATGTESVAGLGTGQGPRPEAGWDLLPGSWAAACRPPDFSDHTGQAPRLMGSTLCPLPRQPAKLHQQRQFAPGKRPLAQQYPTERLVKR